MNNTLVIEKILYYHRRNQERIGQIELMKQQKIHSCNLMRNCIITELTNFSQSVMAFKRNHRYLYPEDVEFMMTIKDYMLKNISAFDQERKGYDR